MLSTTMIMPNTMGKTLQGALGIIPDGMLLICAAEGRRSGAESEVGITGRTTEIAPESASDVGFSRD